MRPLGSCLEERCAAAKMQKKKEKKRVGRERAHTHRASFGTAAPFPDFNVYYDGRKMAEYEPMPISPGEGDQEKKKKRKDKKKRRKMEDLTKPDDGNETRKKRTR